MERGVTVGGKLLSLLDLQAVGVVPILRSYLVSKKDLCLGGYWYKLDPIDWIFAGLFGNTSSLFTPNAFLLSHPA